MCRLCAPPSPLQGLRGSYELSEPGVLLPSSLSPLATPWTHLPDFAGTAAEAEARLAAQSLASNAGVLAAAAAAWQVRGLFPS